jgi:hypothetical protein
MSRIQGNDETGSSLVSQARDRGLYQSFSKLMLSFQGRFQRRAGSGKFRPLMALGRGGVVEAVLEGG